MIAGMRKIPTAFLIILLLLPVSAQEETPPFRSRVFEREFEPALDENGLSGVIVLMMEKGEVVYLKGLGDIPPDLNAPYPIGRLADTFISTTILMLQERGVLEIRAPLEIFESRVTTHQLLNHTAGLGSAVLNPVDWIPAAEITPDTFPRASRFSYCTRCYGLLVDLASTWNGQPYDQLLTDTIFYPLHMDDTRVEDGQIVTTPADMTHWLGMFLQNGRWDAVQLIQPDSIRAMQSPTIPTRRRLNEDYGYGWFVRKNIGLGVRDPAKDRLATAYDLEAYRAQITMIPLYQKGIFILSPEPTRGLEALMDIAVKHFMGWTPPEKNQPESLSLFTGRFRAEDGTEMVIEENNNQLRVRYQGRIYPLDNPETRQFVFRTRGKTATIYFEYTSGSLFSFVLSIDGVTQVFSR